MRGRPGEQRLWRPVFAEASTDSNCPDEALAEAGGGAEGGRTPDLLIANEALSQLSYGPAKMQPRCGGGVAAGARHLRLGGEGVKDWGAGGGPWRRLSLPRRFVFPPRPPP